MFEYTQRYGKEHGCYTTMCEAMAIFHSHGGNIYDHTQASNFARAMPDEFKYDTSIDTFTAYKMYIASKPWVASNYLRMPQRKPNWI